jgi:hypothetical protein
LDSEDAEPLRLADKKTATGIAERLSNIMRTEFDEPEVIVNIEEYP